MKYILFILSFMSLYVNLAMCDDYSDYSPLLPYGFEMIQSTVNYANISSTSSYSNISSTSNYSNISGTSTYANNASTSTYSLNSDTSTYSNNSNKLDNYDSSEFFKLNEDQVITGENNFQKNNSFKGITFTSATLNSGYFVFDLFASTGQSVINLNTNAGVEDTYPIVIDDNRSGTTVNEWSESLIYVDCDSQFLYLVDGQMDIGDNVYLRGLRTVIAGGAFYLNNTVPVYFGNNANSSKQFTHNHLNDGFTLVKMNDFGYSDTTCLEFISADITPWAMTMHDDYEHPNVIYASDGQADTNDYVGVLLGFRYENDVTERNYWHIYPHTGNIDGSFDATVVESTPTIRIGVNSDVEANSSLPQGGIIITTELQIGTTNSSSYIMYEGTQPYRLSVLGGSLNLTKINP